MARRTLVARVHAARLRRGRDGLGRLRRGGRVRGAARHGLHRRRGRPRGVPGRRGRVRPPHQPVPVGGGGRNRDGAGDRPHQPESEVEGGHGDRDLLGGGVRAGDRDGLDAGLVHRRPGVVPVRTDPGAVGHGREDRRRGRGRPGRADVPFAAPADRGESRPGDREGVGAAGDGPGHRSVRDGDDRDRHLASGGGEHSGAGPAHHAGGDGPDADRAAGPDDGGRLCDWSVQCRCGPVLVVLLQPGGRRPDRAGRDGAVPAGMAAGPQARGCGQAAGPGHAGVRRRRRSELRSGPPPVRHPSGFTAGSASSRIRGGSASPGCGRSRRR